MRETLAEIDQKAENPMRIFQYRPILSLVGLSFILLILLINIFFRFAKNEGILFLLSVLNAILLITTLLWGVMGFIELRSILKRRVSLNIKHRNKQIEWEVFSKEIKRIRASLIVNICYLAVFFIQLIYVITHWDNLNI